MTRRPARDVLRLDTARLGVLLPEPAMRPSRRAPSTRRGGKAVRLAGGWSAALAETEATLRLLAPGATDPAVAEVVQEVVLPRGRYVLGTSTSGAALTCADRARTLGARWVIVFDLVEGRLVQRGFAPGPAGAPFWIGDLPYVVRSGVVHRIELPAWPPRCDSPIPAERAQAARDLRHAGGPEAVTQLVALLADAHAVVREAAVSSLMLLRASTAAAPLLAMLSDREWEIVRLAEASLRELGPAARGALVDGLADGRAAVRSGALRLLLDLGIAPPADALATLVDDSDPDLSERSARALADQGDPRALPALLRLAAVSPQAQPLLDRALALLERRGSEVDTAVLRLALALVPGEQYDTVELEDRGGHLPRLQQVPRPPADAGPLQRAAEAELARR